MMNKKELELYVHIPFCAKKCAYCDFLSFPGTLRMEREYVTQLLHEIQIRGAEADDDLVTTIFIGGGTPSILPAEDIAAVMETIRNSFPVSEDAEITLEANPGTVKMESLETYRKVGINRISLGLQSADDQELVYLGRIHTYDEFLKTFQRVRMAGFSNVNVDLISAIPGQSLESWRNTLKRTAMLKPEHISAYSLIVEEGTPYYERYGEHVEMRNFGMTQQERRGLMALPDLPDEDTEREMYEVTKVYLAEQGYDRYEISNYARAGRECRHNIGYWTGAEYLGLGLGASSYYQGWRFHNTRDLGAYVSSHFEEGSQSQGLREEAGKLSKREKMEEFMFLGLRLTKGVSAGDFIRRFGVGIRDVYGEVIDTLKRNGLLEQDKECYRLTSRGLDLSNYAMSEFLLDEAEN